VGPEALREVAAEAPSIVRYCQNTIRYSLSSRFRSWPLIAGRARTFFIWRERFALAVIAGWQLSIVDAQL